MTSPLEKLVQDCVPSSIQNHRVIDVEIYKYILCEVRIN